MILEGHCQDAWSLVLILKPLELLGHLWLHVLGRDPYFLDPFLYHLGHGLRLSRVLSKVWLFSDGSEVLFVEGVLCYPCTDLAWQLSFPEM